MEGTEKPQEENPQGEQTLELRDQGGAVEEESAEETPRKRHWLDLRYPAVVSLAAAMLFALATFHFTGRLIWGLAYLAALASVAVNLVTLFGRKPGERAPEIIGYALSLTILMVLVWLASTSP